MASTAKLAVDIIGRTSSFEQSMKKVHSETSRLNDKFATISRGVRRFATGMLAAAGIAGLGYMLKQTAETIDATAKLSDRLGMATEDLVGYQYGAKIMGVEQSTLNKALETFNQRLGEVRMGTGEAKNALEKLGLSADALAQKSPAEALGIVSDRMRTLKTQADKAAVSSYLFGRAGKQLMNFMEQGSISIAEYRTEAEKLGLTFSRIDAAKVEAANDALYRMKSVFTGVFTQSVINLAPYIEAAATKFVDMSTAGEGMGHNVTQAFEYITIGIARAAQETEELIIKMNRLVSPVESMQKNFAAIKAATLRYREITGEGRRLFPGQPELMDRLLKEERIKVGLEIDPAYIGKIEKFFDDIKAKGKQASGELSKDARSAFEKEVDSFFLRHPTLSEAEIEAMSAAENALLKKDIKQRVGGMTTYMKGLKDDFDNMSLYMSDKFAQFTQVVEGSLGSAFSTAFQGGKDAWEDFMLSIRNAWFDMLGQMMARSIMTASLTPFFPGSVKSAKGNIFDAGKIIPMSRGGIVTRPTVFPMASGYGLMGEAGPEAVMPLKRGPGGRLGVEAAAGPILNVDVQVINRGTNQTVVDKSINYVDRLRKAVVSIVVDDARRNGPATQAIHGNRRSIH